MKIGIVIPARFKSSRYPGKPLIDLCGKPMIQWVYEKCCLAIDPSLVWVATDDLRISNFCAQKSIQCVMTSDQCLTGTDRVREAIQNLDIEGVINVQGDEPLISPEDIKVVISALELNPDKIVNAWTFISNKDEFFSSNVPKLVLNEMSELMYMSRSPIPGNKQGSFNSARKQVCIYGFPKKALSSFCARISKTELEMEEDIEILRFLEMGHVVQMVEVSNNSIAVDTPEDAERVIKVLKKLNEDR